MDIKDTHSSALFEMNVELDIDPWRFVYDVNISSSEFKMAMEMIANPHMVWPHREQTAR